MCRPLLLCCAPDAIVLTFVVFSEMLYIRTRIFFILKAVREEKWLVNCEKDALKRDLERATQRCEQMQSEATLQVAPGASDNQHHDSMHHHHEKKKRVRWSKYPGSDLKRKLLPVIVPNYDNPMDRKNVLCFF